MGDHGSRASDGTRAAERDDDRESWNDSQITAVERRVERRTIHGMPPLERAPAAKSGG